MNREPKHGIGSAKNSGSFDRLSRHAGSVYQVNRSHGASAKHFAETRITPAMVGISIVAIFCVVVGVAFGVSTLSPTGRQLYRRRRQRLLLLNQLRLVLSRQFLNLPE